MIKQQKLEDGTAGEEISRHRTASDSQLREVTAGACVAATNTRPTTKAELPIITDSRWAFFHGTKKVTGGALKGVTAGQNRLYFFCPQCEYERPLRTQLAGVSDDFTEWKSDDRGHPPTPVAVFKIKCPNCGLPDHFKMLCAQHRNFGTLPPLSQAQSRRVAPTAVRPQALVPVIGEEDVNPNRAPFPALSVETDTDYLCLHCPQPHEFKLCNGFRLIAAVLDPESEPTKGNLASISGFQFEWCCGGRCVGDFVIPVTAQEFRLSAP